MSRVLPPRLACVPGVDRCAEGLPPQAGAERTRAAAGVVRLVGAPFPARVALPCAPTGAAVVSIRFASSPHRCGVAGLGSLPTPGVALGAVPGQGARPLGTRSLRSGAT